MQGNDFALVRDGKDQKIKSYDTSSLILGKQGSTALEGIHSSEGLCEHVGALPTQHALFIEYYVSSTYRYIFMPLFTLKLNSMLKIISGTFYNFYYSIQSISFFLIVKL